jgi:hypothetical protein
MKVRLQGMLASVPLILAMAGMPGSAAPAQISWSADRPLTWEDFAGPVAARAAPEHAAMTAASLSWTYAYAFEWSAAACAYRITDIRVAALFDPGKSWVKPDQRTAAILAHEQGHFDITHIHKLMFDDSARRFIGATGVCKGKSEKRIASFIEGEIAARVGPVYEQIWRNHTRVQETYDSETRHGIWTEAQKSWLEKIAAGLRGRRWDELGFERLSR